METIPMCKCNKSLPDPFLTPFRNPICREFAARLEKQGKSKLAIIGAVMNKLLRILFGVLKHQKPFNPNQLKTTQN